MYIICENEIMRSVPKNIKPVSKGERVRMECVLQTVGDVNRNRRRYSKELIESGLSDIKDMIKENSFLGELDHPIDKNPNRQLTVQYKDVSHLIREYGWDGNKLVAVVETLRTPNGTILKNLAEDGIPVGFSFRGMGDIRRSMVEGKECFDVTGPLKVVTWDAVTNPSHKQARMIRITEGMKAELSTAMIAESNKFLTESVCGKNMKTKMFEENGMVCTSDGICYLPNDFDRLVEQKVIRLQKKFGF